MKPLDLHGQVFGRLSVIGESELSTPWLKKWECRCSCGSEKKVHVCTSELRNGHTKSCGCYRLDIIRKFRYSGYELITGSLWCSITSDASKRDIEVELTIEEAWDVFVSQDGKCALTGIDLQIGSGPKWRSRTTASLDRIDSSLHYFKDNVQWLYKKVNLMKRDIDEKEFVRLSTLVANNLKGYDLS